MKLLFFPFRFNMVQTCSLCTIGLQRRRGPGQRVRRPTRGDWRTQCGVTRGLFLLCVLHAPVLWRPDPDYCTGIPPQSVFIRERAKIIQEGSGPLKHLKRWMKGGGCFGFWGGAGDSYFERGELCRNTMKPSVTKYTTDPLNLYLIIIFSLRSAANFPVI